MCKWNKTRTKGLTFIELIVSFTWLTVAMLGFLQLFNVALDSQLRASQEIIATNLAQGLMAEIMTKEFIDPTDPSPALGPNIGETGRSGLSPFDDVDDYEGLTEATPVTIDGQPMDGTGGRPNYSGFSRSVNVDYCDVDAGNNINCPTAGPIPTDYKKAIVTVSGPRVKDIIIDELKVN